MAIKHVLIVDDERSFLESLVLGLQPYASLDVLTASNGAEAVEILGEKPVDMVVTDLRMPTMDGFALMAHLSRSHPEVPAIAMTAYASPAALANARALGLVNVLEKPIDLDELADEIFRVLTRQTKGFLQGISVASILQLLQLEGKTATLTVGSGHKEGKLFMLQGRLVDAESEARRGDEAAMAIIGWTDAQVEITDACHPSGQTVVATLDFLIMESLRRSDESLRQSAELGDPGGERRPSIDADPARGDEAADQRPIDLFFDGFEESLDSSGHDSAARGASEPGNGAAEAPSVSKVSKEERMSLESHLKQLRDVKGYKAAAIMNFTGEVLASDSSDPSVDLALVGATFNDIFRAAHEASKKIGMEATNETVIKTPKGLIIMNCSGTSARVHFHMITVLTSDGNQALAKMRLEAEIPKIMNEL